VQATVTAKMGDVGGKFFGKIPDPACAHHYYIAAESVLWDYAPQGRDVVCGKPFPPPLLKSRASVKTRFVQYTDDTFQTRARNNPGLGIMGPVLRGKVGEYLVVTFFNRTLGPLSMHPHGVKFDKDSEGSYYQPSPGLGGAVGRGAKFTYVWQLDEASGPSPGEPSSKAWLYHSYAAGDEEIQRGLMGCIIVTDPRRARADGSPNDVDRELATLYMVFDESGVVPREVEAPDYEPPPRPTTNAPGIDWAKTQQLIEQGARYSINGLIYGNLPGLEMNEGERVRWYVFALGSEVDFHTAHWHGLRVVEDGHRRTDVVELLPATMKVADMVADNPGSWLLHCHVSEHMQEGMFARVTVHPRNSPRAPQSTFLGLGAAVQSLQITRAELSGPSPENRGLKLQGTVTVPEAFSVVEGSVTLQVAEKTYAFVLDASGGATKTGNSFQVKNADRSGVVHGGLMEFKSTLSGRELQQELQIAGATQTAADAPPRLVPIAMSVDSVAHSAHVQIKSFHKDR
jgi:FtsP/CotA-like multicopper oxidase with cupredoxin domain